MRSFAPLFLILAIPAFAPAAESKNTAQYVEFHADELKGKQVSLDVTHVVPAKEVSEKAKPHGIRFFRVHTLNKKNQQSGGAMTAIVEEGEAERFMKKYGYTPDVTKGRDRVTDSRIYRATVHVAPDGKLCLFDSEEAGKAAIDLFVEIEAGRKNDEVTRPAREEALKKLKEQAAASKAKGTRPRGAAARKRGAGAAEGKN